MDEGVSWYSTGVDYASPQENIVAALALVYHATSTGSEQLLKEHMTEIMTGSVDYTPDGSWRPPSTMLPEVAAFTWCAAGQDARLARGRVRPTRRASEWSPTKVHQASALRGPLHYSF